MPEYRFTAVEPTTWVKTSRKIVAASREEAAAVLAADGIDVGSGELVEIAPAPPAAAGSLRPDDAVRVADGLAGLTAARLPLESGLEALAEELPVGPRRWALLRVAQRLRRGEPLATAGVELPRTLRTLLAACSRGGRFVDVFSDMASIEMRRLELHRRLWPVVVYAALLLGFSLLLFTALGFFVVPNFESIFKDFGTMLPPLTTVVVTVVSPAGTIVAFGATMVVVAAFAGLLVGRTQVPWFQDRFYGLPLVGPMSRYADWAEALRLLGLLVRMRIPLPEALRRAADAHPSPSLRDVCRGLAWNVEQGLSLAAAMGRDPRVPQRLQPLVENLDDPDALDATLTAAAETFEAQASQRTGLIRVILLPCILVAVLSFVGLIIVALFMPLISLIQKLS
jgi:type II secretory pathway component PulF